VTNEDGWAGSRVATQGIDRRRVGQAGGQRQRPSPKGGRGAAWIAPGWVTATVGIVTVAIVIAVIASTPGSKPADKHSMRALADVRPRVVGVPAVEAGLFSWRLPAPISREVLLPQPGTGELIVAGGTGENGSSSAGAFQLNTSTGRLAQIGDLAAAAHDAASTVLGREVLVFSRLLGPASSTTPHWSSFCLRVCSCRTTTTTTTAWSPSTPKPARWSGSTERRVLLELPPAS
jgi:hypothetical protein